MKILRITVILFVAIAAPAQAASWKTQQLPLPAGAGFVQMGGASCLSSKWCEAVGTFAHGNGGRVMPFAAHWDGKRWTVQTMPAPASGGELHAVSCFSTGACVAVGFGSHHCSNSYDKCAGPPFSENFSHGRWALQQIATQSDHEELTGVSCFAPTGCIAVGTEYDAPGPADTLGLAQRWDGRRWTRVSPLAPAQPPGATASQALAGISCHSAQTCTAVGSEFREFATYSVNLPLAESWNGTTWSARYPPLRGQPRPNYADDQGATLNGVACSSPTNCAAVGAAFVGNCTNQCSPASQPTTAITEGLGATGWANTGTSQPRGELGSVSCWSSSGCLAIGQSNPDDLNSISELWNGTTWTVGTKRRGLLEGVSCPPAATPGCVVVGETPDSSQAFAERYS